ncbi:MAG TPA: hypothetical protein VFC67_20280, partial [Prolixibacteraceae bacterium]|nr:hypothetical protein [Prolixibacteraceae bacterium]
PETGILFLFFSNRVYPTRANNLINHLKIRELIQETACEILQNPKPASFKTEILKPKPVVNSRKPGVPVRKPAVRSRK